MRIEDNKSCQASSFITSPFPASNIYLPTWDDMRRRRWSGLAANRKVASSIPCTSSLSPPRRVWRCPWARHLTPHCSRRAGCRMVDTAVGARMCAWVGEFVNCAILQSALSGHLLEKRPINAVCVPFTIYLLPLESTWLLVHAGGVKGACLDVLRHPAMKKIHLLSLFLSSNALTKWSVASEPYASEHTPENSSAS